MSLPGMEILTSDAEANEAEAVGKSGIMTAEREALESEEFSTTQLRETPCDWRLADFLANNESSDDGSSDDVHLARYVMGKS